ncbi:MAG: DEAD/DEAH box helicase [Bradymonadia bacterium]
MLRPSPDRPLDAKEVDKVLHYWLSALQHEEALAMRPRAAPPHKGPPRLPDLLQPGYGRTYFKMVHREDEPSAPLMLKQQKQLDLHLDGERMGLFERWLYVAYRKERNEALGFVQDARPPMYVVGFPTLYFQRGGELATLLRCPLDAPNWLDEQGKPWMPPTWHERKRGKIPPLPARLRLSLKTDVNNDDDEVASLPYTLDPEVAQGALKIGEEEIDDYHGALKRWAHAAGGDLSPEIMVAATHRLLTMNPEDGWPNDLDPIELVNDPEWPSEPQAQVQALHDAVVARIGGGTRSFPIGLVYDGSQGYATHHLQRDLQALRQRKARFDKGSPLWGYLSGRASLPRRGRRNGGWSDRGLTGDQHLGAEQFLGSSLTAIQGPPGTGKTELILNLLADGLVSRVRRMYEAFLTEGRPRMSERPTTVITSTNNRAVDNVLDPLCADLPDDRLPLGIRTGSQEVMATVTVNTLERCMSWLSKQDTTGARAAFNDALKRFDEGWKALKAELAPEEAARKQAEQRTNLEQRIAELERLIDDDLALLPRVDRDYAALLLEEEPRPNDAQARQALVAQAVQRVRVLRSRLNRLAESLDRRQIRAPKAMEKRYLKEASGPQDRLERLLDPLEVSLNLDLPQGAGADLDAWQEAIEDGVDELTDRLSHLKAMAAAARRAAEREDLVTALAAENARAPIPEAPPLESPERATLRMRVFMLSVVVRERWAILRQKKLLLALDTALESVRGRRGLRRLMEDDDETASWLCKLFPTWGCTLLSLGNVFPPESSAVHQVIIDEAGQCHPAYAISGLVRARRALIIGDTHQLEPVIQLTASDEQRVKLSSKLPDDDRFDPYRLRSARPPSAQSLANRASAPLTLHDHFRCQREIIEISDALCHYNLTVRTPENSLVAQVPQLDHPVLHLQVDGRQQRWGGSWFNEEEIGATLAVVNLLARGGIPWGDIAIITPYRGQLERLRRRLNQSGVPCDDATLDPAPTNLSLFGPPSSVALGTVHRFQGGERSVVIFSTVITRGRSLGFLNDRVNLLNVAVSRARDHLVIIGDASALVQGQYTDLLLRHGRPMPAF